MNINPTALIHLGFAVIIAAFCGVAMFAVHDATTQGDIWKVVYLLIGLWFPSPTQQSYAPAIVTALQQVSQAIQKPAQNSTQASAETPKQ